MRRAVFLDRDGVLNQTNIRDGKPYAPMHMDDFKIVPGAKNILGRLQTADLLLVVVTNQPDVGNKRVERKTVEHMNMILQEELSIDAVKCCFHKQDDNCVCRKPKPGMILEAAHELEVDLSSSFMIGDRRSDIIAGNAAGCCTIFLDNGYRESERPNDNEAAAIVSNLDDAASFILAEISSS